MDVLVIKRDGRETSYTEEKIFQAILNAFNSVGKINENFENSELLKDISDLVGNVTDNIIEQEYERITVDCIQEIVIDELLESEFNDVAKEYIEYSVRKNVERENMDTQLKKYTVKTIKVQKKSGLIEEFDINKLYKALQNATYGKISKGLSYSIVSSIDKKISNLSKDLVTTDELHNLVEETLKEQSPETYEKYAMYRQYKKQMAKSFNQARNDSENILSIGDDENANKDSALNSTKQTLIAEAIMKQYMLNFELKPEWAKAHKKGWLYIHDLSQRYLRQQNCCLFNITELLKGGFMMNGAEYLEPKTLASALAVIGDVTLQASGQQLGGFTLPELDTVLAPYVEKSYQKYLSQIEDLPLTEVEKNTFAKKQTLREIEQAIQGFETKLNTISSSLGQTPLIQVA